MVNRLQVPVSFLLIVAAVLWYFYGSQPQNPASGEVNETEFSIHRAFEHVKAIAKEPHSVGTKAHEVVQEYIVKELEKLGLEAEIQEDYVLSPSGVLTRPQNILAKMEGSGTGKALLLLSHYDSAVHSSSGASDAGSGVATILEGVRAFLASENKPVNDIIILFTDAEELDLNGAQLFVSQHRWASEVGLALNFEARGSGGSSFMLLETDHGSKNLINHFVEANPKFPVTNSLAFSVYKMLPNSTDLTVFREDGGIDGFNFAFLDDHFDYHTANDTPENLDLNSLAHQGSYLMPLLEYFSQVPLENFSSSEDLIYFDIPIFHMVTYPFSWIWPIFLFAVVLFIGLIVYGVAKKRLNPGRMFIGFVPLLISLVGAGLGTFLLWKLCLLLYPQYLEMDHGFTYNGYYYISAAISLSLGICFLTYKRFRKAEDHGELFIAPLFLWLFICALAAAYLQGASYFVVPALFGLLQLFVLIRQKNPNLVLLSFLSLPAIYILFPLILSFPVALGLKILFVAAILSAFLWTFLWPVFRFYKKLSLLGFLSLSCFLGLFFIAHFKADFTAERQKPNSLVYILDSDAQTAAWYTYDGLGDDWIGKYFGEGATELDTEDKFSSKYSAGFTKSATAPLIPLEEPLIFTERFDSLGKPWYGLKIVPQRNINRIEIFTKNTINFEEFTVNGLEAAPQTAEEDSYHIFKRRWTNRLLTYYAVNQDTLKFKFSMKGAVLPEFTIYEASNDLLENKALKVPPRSENMIPRPFVLNDAVIIKKTIHLE